MIKNLLYLLVIAIIGWVVYVTIFGKPDEIKLRDKLLNKGKELGMAVSDIFQSERKKVNSGEYDKVFSKLNETIAALKSASNSTADDEEITRLSQEKDRIEKSIKENEGNEAKLEEENKKLQILADEIVKLTKKIEG